jgi:hypothetical protein
MKDSLKKRKTKPASKKKPNGAMGQKVEPARQGY